MENIFVFDFISAYHGFCEWDGRGGVSTSSEWEREKERNDKVLNFSCITIINLRPLQTKVVYIVRNAALSRPNFERKNAVGWEKETNINDIGLGHTLTYTKKDRNGLRWIRKIRAMVAIWMQIYNTKLNSLHQHDIDTLRSNHMFSSKCAIHLHSILVCCDFLLNMCTVLIILRFIWIRFVHFG